MVKIEIRRVHSHLFLALDGRYCPSRARCSCSTEQNARPCKRTPESVTVYNIVAQTQGPWGIRRYHLFCHMHHTPLPLTSQSSLITRQHSCVILLESESPFIVMHGQSKTQNLKLQFFITEFVSSRGQRNKT